MNPQQPPNGLPVTVTQLGAADAEWPSSIDHAAGKTMLFSIPDPLACGSPVKVESADTLWLGEVRSCRPVEGGYQIELDVVHALYDLPALARLAERFTGKARQGRVQRAEDFIARSK